jgi:hypothetical protein
VSYYSGRDLAIFHQHPHVTIATSSPVHFLVNSCHKEIGLYIHTLPGQNLYSIYIHAIFVGVRPCAIYGRKEWLAPVAMPKRTNCC